MAQSRNKAVIAGLTAALTLGSVTLPAMATTSNSTPMTDSDPDGMGVPLPGDYDKADYYEGSEGVVTFASVRSGSTLTPVALSDEMKYFTKYESGCNYDKGLSYGDGYNAMGYYQFDRRYSLLPFIQQVYSYNPTKYAMFQAVIAQRDTLSNPSYSMYDYTTRQLTAPAQILNEAWHAAYAADPVEFSALQDAYAFNNYYLPVQSSLLNTYGVDVRNRADCVKGLVWGMCNLFGQGGVQKFFKAANINNAMSDRELVTALCDTVVNRVAEWYPKQPQYHQGWQNRYKKEKAACLAYLDQHDAGQNAGGQEQGGDASNGGGAAQQSPGTGAPNEPSVGTPDNPSAGDQGTSGPSGGTSDSGSDNGGNTGGGSASDGNNGGSSPGSDAGTGESGDASTGDTSTGDGAGNSGSGDQGGNTSNGGTTSEDDKLPDDDSFDSTDDAGDDSDESAHTHTFVKAWSHDGKTHWHACEDETCTGHGSEEAHTSDTWVANGTDHWKVCEVCGTAFDIAPHDFGEWRITKQATEAEKGVRERTCNTCGKVVSEEYEAESAKTTGAQSTSGGSSKEGLPGTGDIISMVAVGATGLAVAGGSFLSLAKKERDEE